MFDRRLRHDSEETAVEPRPRLVVIATAIGGDTWEITIPELTGRSTVALSEQEVEVTARQWIADITRSEHDAFDIDVRRIPYPLPSS